MASGSAMTRRSDSSRPTTTAKLMDPTFRARFNRDANKQTPDSSQLITKDRSANDVVRTVKKHYVPPRDNPDSENKIKSRNFEQFGYLTDTADTERAWDDKYARQQVALQQGEFTPRHKPYTCLGNFELEPNKLFVRNFENSLPKWLMELSAESASAAGDKVGEGLHKDAKQTAVQCEQTALRQRQKAARAAGMRIIRQQLQESEDRRVATRAGQPYMMHVRQCQDSRAAELLQQRQAASKAGEMLLQKMSSHTLINMIRTKPQTMRAREVNTDDDAQPSTPSIFSHFSYLRYRTMKKVNTLSARLECIYNVLCSLHNIKSRYLRQREPLSIDIVKALRRDPFARQEMGSDFHHSRMSKAQRSGSEDLTMDAGAASIASKQGFRGSIMHYSGATKHDMSRTITTPSCVLPPGGGGGGTGSALSYAGRLGKGKGRLTMYLEAGSVRVDTWDDLLMTGLKSKTLRTLKKSQLTPPPWQQTITLNPIIVPQTKEGSGGDEEYDADQAVSNMQRGQVAVKEHLQKKAQQDMDRLVRERSIKFRYKLETMDSVPALMHEQREQLNLVTKEASKDPSLITEDTAPWYEQLVQEANDLGIRHEDQIVHNLILLEKFILDDLHSIANVMEKLCLLTISLPVYEICTLPIQLGIKFVLTEILGSEDLLADWLSYRKLYVIQPKQQEE